jgi:hypothetical protein
MVRARSEDIPPFDRDFFGSREHFTRIGHGSIGGKARGLADIRDLHESELCAGEFPEIELAIPTLTVLATDLFDLFMERNNLYDLALSDSPDDRIAHGFQKADLPTEMLGDLRGLIDRVHTPLAVRSSSLLEDALYQPFAGVYATKMIPNNQPDADTRFRRLVEAIKLVYASTFFRAAKSYIAATQEDVSNEKMAVILQEVVGRRHGDRYYPDISAVVRSYNFYPTGPSRPEEGVVNLALGLGKTIVDGGVSWTYSPAHPAAPPPFGSVGDLVKNTQIEFWAVNMGRPPAYDPTEETEYLVKGDLTQAEYDGSLDHIASTYIAGSDRLTMGIGGRGPRVLDFARLLRLREVPFNELVKKLLEICKEKVNAQVEIELAMIFEGARRARLGFLQVRPMVVSGELVEITSGELEQENLLVASDRVMGNGVIENIHDVVYVKPESFEAKWTRRIASELERINASLLSDHRIYVLIGFGRWGSSDPWLGIPVEWGQICAARVIVEATLPTMNTEPSQGSHFFHNITAFRVGYLSVHHDRRPGIDWEWLTEQPAVEETELVRHVKLTDPLLVKLDGRTGLGGIWHRR